MRRHCNKLQATARHRTTRHNTLTAQHTHTYNTHTHTTHTHIQHTHTYNTHDTAQHCKTLQDTTAHCSTLQQWNNLFRLGVDCYLLSDCYLVLTVICHSSLPITVCYRQRWMNFYLRIHRCRVLSAKSCHTATCCKIPQRMATHSSTLPRRNHVLRVSDDCHQRSHVTRQHAARHCKTLQHTATHGNALQHAATQESCCTCESSSFTWFTTNSRTNTKKTLSNWSCDYT